MSTSEVESSTTGTASETAPHPRRRLIFAVVSIALFMAAVDQTIVATALPAIQRELAAPVNWSGWTITIYALGQVLMMPVAGRISDQFGRRKVFLAAAVLFTASSLACGFANDVYVLVALRAVQAIGGGAFMPSATGIIADNFGRERDRALGMFTSIFPIGGIVGPIAGGVFTAFWSWRGIFLINVPIGLLLIALAAKYLPASKPRDTGRVDFAGVTLLGVLVFTSMFGVTYLGSAGTSVLSPVFLASEAIAVITLVFFVRHGRRYHAPFIPFELIRGRGFGVMNLINLCYGAAALGFGALIPLYAEDRFHIQPLEAGTLLTARAVGTICVAALAVLALRRTGHRLPMLVGFLLSAVSLAAMYVVPHGLSPYVWLAIAAGVSGVGMGMAVPASNNASLQLAPDKVAAIAGLRGMFRQSGAIMSISITTAVIARSNDAGMAQATILLVFAGLMIAVLPLLALVPDHRGSW